MKKIIVALVVLFGLFGNTETVDVYILSGQSNMQGIAKLRNLNSKYKQVRENVFFWTGSEFAKLEPGITKTSARKSDFGPEIGFSYILDKMHPERKVFLIKYFASGQPLHYGWNGNKWIDAEKSANRWNFYPGDKQNGPKMGLHYKRLKTIFTKALQSLKQKKVDYKVRGIVWMQGEQDTKNPVSANEYAKCLRQFKKILEMDLATPNLPLVFGQVCPFTPARARFINRIELRQSQANAHYSSGHSDAIPGVFMVPTEGMPVLPDTVHYNAEGQIMLGQEMGLAMLQMQNELKPKPKTNPVDKIKPVVKAFEELKLWPDGNPDGWVQEKAEESESRGGVTRIKNINNPRIMVFAPKSCSRKKAVLICPGGGYAIEAIDKEGNEIAEYLNKHGYAAFVLKYRLPKEGEKRYVPALQDAQRALSIIRSKAKDYGIDKVGVMGFSAGGHLTATTVAHSNQRTYKVVDGADDFSCAPDFAALIYPAYLVKNKNSGELAPEVSVAKSAVPTFLVQTSDDPIPVENSLYYYLALKRRKVPAQLHIYPKGPHGYGLRCGEKAVAAWPQLLVNWLANQ